MGQGKAAHDVKPPVWRKSGRAAISASLNFSATDPQKQGAPQNKAPAQAHGETNRRNPQRISLQQALFPSKPFQTVVKKSIAGVFEV
jgi:hypothetical protein